MRGDSRRRAINVLLVEDNDDDAAFIKAALSKTVREERLHWTRDAQETLDFVHQRGAFVEAPRPDLIFLDLHLPGGGGPALLESLKGDAALQSIPVVVLSGSDDEADVLACYQAKANSYLRKPEKMSEFESLADAIRDYWINTVQLPPR